MSRYVVVKRIVLEARHQPTGKTRHYHGKRELPPAAVLKIGKYDGEEGFYLFYFDADGHELTDTFHDTLEEALAQAEWEYGVEPDEWRAGDVH